MQVRKSDVRCNGKCQEYPGAYAWPEYEYRCPVCGKWGEGSSTTEVHEDATESYLCENCAEGIDFSEPHTDSLHPTGF